MNKTVNDLVSGAKLYRVWLHQAYHVLSSKYKRTILGTLWIAGNFIFTSLAITIVFGFLFKQNLKDFLPYSMLGNLVGTTCLWIFSEAPEIFISQSSIIKNHAYPFTFFSFESVARSIMLFAHNLIVFYVFMLFNGTLTIPNWTVIPGLVVVMLTMMSWGTVLGMLAARYRDLRFLIPNFSNLLFFVTPLYWKVENLGPHRWIADYNPLYNLVSLVRVPLMGGSPTEWNWTFASCFCIAGVFVWFLMFAALRRRIPFWV